MSDNLVQTHNDQKISNFHPVTDTEDDGNSMTMIDRRITILESALSHMKLMFPVQQVGLQQENFQEEASCDYHNNEASCRNSKESQCDNVLEYAMDESVRDLHGRETGPFTFSSSVDAFWPLCMFELRGKCNNDECPWQHLGDLSNKSLFQHHIVCQISICIKKVKF